VTDVICRDVLVELVKTAGLDDRKDLGHQFFVLLALVTRLADAAQDHNETYESDRSEKPSPGHRVPPSEFIKAANEGRQSASLNEIVS